jgi:hypothetical protein
MSIVPGRSKTAGPAGQSIPRRHNTMPTYYAAKDFTVETRDIKAGTKLGTGDIAKGEFTPEDEFANLIGIGHVQARADRNLITTENPKSQSGSGSKSAGKLSSSNNSRGT